MEDHLFYLAYEIENTLLCQRLMKVYLHISSSLTIENNIRKSVCSKNRFVSSANIIGSSTEELGRSLTYNKKSNSPSIEHCGTPQRMF